MLPVWFRNLNLYALCSHSNYYYLKHKYFSLWHFNYRLRNSSPTLNCWKIKLLPYVWVFTPISVLSLVETGCWLNDHSRGINYKCHERDTAIRVSDHARYKCMAIEPPIYTHNLAPDTPNFRHHTPEDF